MTDEMLDWHARAIAVEREPLVWHGEAERSNLDSGPSEGPSGRTLAPDKP
jgi:hypothetical protein